MCLCGPLLQCASWELRVLQSVVRTKLWTSLLREGGVVMPLYRWGKPKSPGKLPFVLLFLGQQEHKLWFLVSCAATVFKGWISCLYVVIF